MFSGLSTRKDACIFKYKSNQIEIEIVNSHKDLQVQVDSRWMDSVLTNLIANAIQYSPVGGKIKMKVEISDDGLLQIFIIDEGQGIKDKDVNKIFNRFESSRKTRPHSVLKGSGLGLFIAKSIVNGHGGIIGLKPCKKGCTFFFTLPQYKYSKERKIS